MYGDDLSTLRSIVAARVCNGASTGCDGSSSTYAGVNAGASISSGDKGVRSASTRPSGGASASSDESTSILTRVGGRARASSDGSGRFTAGAFSPIHEPVPVKKGGIRVAQSAPARQGKTLRRCFVVPSAR